MEEKMIYRKLVAIMQDTNAIAKGQVNKEFNFRYRGIDDMMDSLHAVFAKHGVFIITEILSHSMTQVPKKNGGMMYYTTAEVKHHYVAEDGSEVCTLMVGLSMDSGDKGMNKAVSVALKYSLIQMLLIPTQDAKDPDAESPQLSNDAETVALAEVAQCKTKEDCERVWDKWKTTTSISYKGSKFYEAVKDKHKELDGCLE